jgi:hypothetical protein
MVTMRKILLSLLLVLCSGNIIAQNNYADLGGTKSAISLLKQYRLANLYEYRADAKTGDSVLVKAYGYEIAEEALTRKYNDILKVNTADSISSRIILKSRLVLEIDNERHTFIKHQLNAPANDQTLIVINFVFRNGRWEENQNPTSETELIKNVFSMCKPETLFAFFNERNNPSQPEINKLKPLVKNESGVLDIKLLEGVISQNKISLAKYLE